MCIYFTKPRFSLSFSISSKTSTPWLQTHTPPNGITKVQTYTFVIGRKVRVQTDVFATFHSKVGTQNSNTDTTTDFLEFTHAEVSVRPPTILHRASLWKASLQWAWRGQLTGGGALLPGLFRACRASQGTVVNLLDLLLIIEIYPSRPPSAVKAGL